MKTKTTILNSIALAALVLCGMSAPNSASDVETRMSTREAYVGMPVVFQIVINNAEDYQQPTIPEIDGCDIRSAGAPSQSSQITIINGRRSASRSITMQYLITPRRVGTFEIPSFTVNVDGRDVQTRPQKFVATKSDTGDLMFVEIEGGKDKVFVGQPLDLTLKIWIKPYVDREKNITLSEANMWQTISEQASWGSFADRINELAQNNQRPGGREVLRDDGQGNQRSYYLYEIDATVYPKRPGQIDADDVQIVAKYPTGLKKSRDPFESMFKDSPFGGSSPFGRSSPLSQLLDDEFFSSPFRNRLSVSSVRPIVAQTSVDATEVMPVPTDGRPDDYRGAVGRYKIVTQATSNHVSAGDPITLNIGIAGTGPMELVQAPPLATLPSLTTDFKVTDEPLAGFVQDETKVFSTKIRPRREGITQIPPIPFSFFDPETETFETVMSQPISITVDKAETLALDSIVGNARRPDQGRSETATATNRLEPDFSNFESTSGLVPQMARSSFDWWWLFVIMPPVAWLVTLCVCHREAIIGRLPSFKSAEARCLHSIKNADSVSQIVSALIQFIANRSGKSCCDETTAVGALRTHGLYSTAIAVESFFSQCDRQQFNGANISPSELKKEAKLMVGQIETAFVSSKKSQIKRTANRKLQISKDNKMGMRKVNGTARRLSMIIFGLAIAIGSSSAFGANASSLGSNASAVILTEKQQQTIFEEANQAYSKARQIVETDSAEANELFATAAEKYQLLVDSGISNSQLYFNLGNVYLQSNRLGHAIVNYERAKQIDPGDQQLNVNLEFANSLVKGPDGNAESNRSRTSILSLDGLRSVNETVVKTVGSQTLIWILVISSVSFWAILITRTIGYQFSTWRYASLPFCILLLSIASIGLMFSAAHDETNGVIVVEDITLYSGDGEQFDIVAEMESAQGQRVQVLAQRGAWTQIAKAGSATNGWVQSFGVQRIDLAHNQAW